MKKLTVDPVPTPTTAPSRTNSSAACAARNLFESWLIRYPQKQLCPLSRAQSSFRIRVPALPCGGAVTPLLRFDLLLLGSLFLGCFLLGRLLCLSHINLHVGLVRAQYLQKSNLKCKRCVMFSDDAARSLTHRHLLRSRVVATTMTRSWLFFRVETH